MLVYYLKKSIYKFLSAISKEMFLKFQFRRLVGYRLNLKSPKTYNEKLQWLKLYYRDEKMSQCADKVEVREYIKDKGLGDGAELRKNEAPATRPAEITITGLPSIGN